jgi:acyl-CoA thioesterase-1
MKKLLILTSLLISTALSSLCAEAAPKKPGLPQVLLIGDSISVNYTPYVTEILKGKALVKHHKGNAGPTIFGVAKIDKWLGSNKWDVIHFNWGLWDMYGWEYWKQDRSPAKYKERLEKLVSRLEDTGAILIWATTTPVCSMPEKGMVNRFKEGIPVVSPETEKKYLDVAREVMEKHKININDLHALMKGKLNEYALADNNVHYNTEGRKKLAEQVAIAIQESLKGEQTN